MLRYLTVANWKSVYSPVEFSLVATSERRHGERLARVGRSRVLPVAALLRHQCREIIGNSL